MVETFPPVRLGARVIPIPKSVSPRAQASLAKQLYPPVFPTSADGWRDYIRDFNAEAEARHFPYDLPATVSRSGRVYVGVPHQLEHPGRAILYFHGGGLVLLGGRMSEFYAALEAARYGHTVHAVDFRVPPDNPYPAGLEDCFSAYRATLDNYAPSQIAFYGLSGGANLAAATCLMAKAEAVPLPACVVLESPQLDLTESGDSFQTNYGVDVTLRRGIPEMNALYAAGHDLADPLLSPIFADLTGFPPTMLLSGTRDLFLSNAVRMHRALRRFGREADLHVWEAAPHGGFEQGAPESVEARREIKRFFLKHWT
jgi:acetyl esterase/lipase